MRLRLASLAVLFLLVACGSDTEPTPPDDGAAPCVPGRACAKACTSDAQCQAREVCSGGLCGQPVATSTQYNACALDADCPAGDHCSLGACTHACLSDRDCGGGTVCTSRGRCAAPETVSATPPPAPPETLSSARLTLAERELGFAAEQTQQQLVLRNTGGEPLRYRVLSDRVWLSAEPSSGTVESGGSVTLQVRADRAAAGADTQAVLRVNSTGGFSSLNVRITQNLTGLYSGEVRFTQPVDVATSVLRLSLSQESTGAPLTGVVVPEGSLLFPMRSAVTGTLVGNQLELSFVLAGNTGSPVNPRLRRPLRRTVRLTGQVTPTGVVEGTVTDTFEGPFQSPTAVQMRGTFRLQRVGAALTSAPDNLPALDFAPAPNPFTGATYETCRNNCPVVGGCDDALEAGRTYLATAANFYARFKSVADSLSGNPFELVRTNCDGSCLNTVALRCAQYHYAQVLLAPETGTPVDVAARTTARTGLLDSLEVMADYSTLFGNAKLVEGVDSWRIPQTSLGAERVAFQAARATFALGLHGQSATEPAAMFDPVFLQLLESPHITSGTLRDDGNLSQLDEILQAVAEFRAPREYLRRAALALGGGLRAGLEEAGVLHRLQREAEAQAAIAQTAVAGYVDVAVLAALLVKSYDGAAVPANGLPDLDGLRSTFAQLSRKYDALAAGRNPAGYLPDYVPFMPNATTASGNYAAFATYARQSLREGAERDQADASNAQRAFESDLGALTTQLQNEVLQYNEQMNRLCGRDRTAATCGAVGSDFELAKRDVEAALLRMAAAQRRYDNLLQEIVIEQTRATKVTDTITNYANLVQANGEKMRVLAWQEHNFRRTALIAESIAGGIGGILSLGGSNGNPAALCSAIGAAVGGAVRSEGEYNINKKRAALQLAQSLQVEYDRRSIELANSEAVIATKNLEAGALSIEIDIAKQGWERAAAALVGIFEQARLVDEQRTRINALRQQNVRKMLDFRVLADDTSLRAADSLRTYRRWAFLATRAMEYDLNVSYVDAYKLWQARNATAVTDYLTAMDLYYQDASQQSVQPYLETFSLRDLLLDLNSEQVDPVTGARYSARERFRRFVADPTNRDVNGNLRLNFMTFRPDKPIFSRAVCNDRIKKIWVNLVGDNLGAGVTYAFVRLTHGGTNYLRACTGSNALVAYNLTGTDNRPRVANIQAGINAPNVSQTMSENTDFAMRALQAGPWELVIEHGPTASGPNAKLLLEGLDDIELVVAHEASTIQ